MKLLQRLIQSCVNPSPKESRWEIYSYIRDLAKSQGCTLSLSDAKLIQEYIMSDLDDSNLMVSIDSKPATDASRATRRLLKIFRKLRSQVPVELAVHKGEFFGHSLNLRNGVLVPRPETERLAELALQQLDSHPSSLHILEMGAGSGAIGVAIAYGLAKSNRQFSYLGYEPSRRAFLLSLQNMRSIVNPPSPSSIRLVNTPLTANTRLKRSHWDLLVANPPYIPTEDFNRGLVAPSVVKHEPLLALHGGEDGLDHYRAIAALAKHYVIDTIVLETHHTTAGAIATLLIETGNYKAEVVQDVFERDRYVLAHRIG